MAQQSMSSFEICARDMSAAGLANAFSSALLNPSDVTKIRLQSPGGAALYASLADCVRQIIRHEGISALWLTGLPASMLRESETHPDAAPLMRLHLPHLHPHRLICFTHC
jgi:hypothetical protein